MIEIKTEDQILGNKYTFICQSKDFILLIRRAIRIEDVELEFCPEVDNVIKMESILTSYNPNMMKIEKELWNYKDKNPEEIKCKKKTNQRKKK